MTVSFSPVRPSFRSNNTSSTQTCNHHICPTCGKPIDCSEEQPQKKKGFFTRVKDGFINFRKGCIDFFHIVGGTAKGIVLGSLSAGVVLCGNALKNTVKKAPKTLSLGGKVLAGLVGTAVLAYNVVKAKLNANQEKANLDHRWETGHNA